MKVSNIYNSLIKNNNISFGRVIKISSQSNPVCNTYNRQIDSSTFEIAKILNGEQSHIYTKEETEKIRSYFKNILKDYNGKTGVLMRRNPDGDIILLSGQDAKDIKAIEKQSKEQKYKQKKRKNNFFNIHFMADKEIKKRVENGMYDKVSTTLEFKNSNFTKESLSNEQKMGKTPIRLKFNNFNYISQKRTYIYIEDGYIHPNIPEDSEKDEANIFMNLEYEENHLQL